MNNINLPVAELKPALTGLGKVIGKRTTLPVLGMVKVDRTKDGWITLTGSDLDSFLTVRLEEPSEGVPVSILVPHEDLTRITKRCQKDEAIVIEKASGDKASIKFPVGNQTVEEHVESLPEVEYPPVPKIKGAPMSLNNDIRLSLLDAFECASTDSTRAVIHSAYIDVSDKNCQHIVGTDGRHLFASNSFTLPLQDSLIVPTNKFLGWKEFNNDGEWQLRVQNPEKKDDTGLLQISSRRWRFITRQVLGTYPNWRQVIPGVDQFNGAVDIEPAAIKDLIQTIERMPCNDSFNHRIGVKVEGRKVIIVGQTDDKPVNVEIMEATAKSRDIAIYLNREFLVKALKFGLCRLQITDEVSPLRFSDGNGRQMIVMPIRPETRATPVNHPPEQPAESESTTNNERSNMPHETKTNGSHAEPNGDKPALELAITQAEAARESLKTAVTSVTALVTTLRLAQREQRASEKEIQGVRSTLEKVQALRI